MQAESKRALPSSGNHTQTHAHAHVEHARLVAEGLPLRAVCCGTSRRRTAAPRTSSPATWWPPPPSKLVRPGRVSSLSPLRRKGCHVCARRNLSVPPTVSGYTVMPYEYFGSWRQTWIGTLDLLLCHDRAGVLAHSQLPGGAVGAIGAAAASGGGELPAGLTTFLLAACQMARHR